jgi:hypothetical protein
MSINTEILKKDLDRLTHNQIQQVADYIAFLKFRDRRHMRLSIASTQLASLLDFADEDRALAEAGMSDYAVALIQEDQL